MIDKAAEVTVALSGGADSVALLAVMLKCKDELKISVSAAHLNHCLRGAESDRDEQFVRDLCQKLNVPLYCEKADVALYAKENSLSIELAARKVRYEFLERVTNGVVATAHNANDNMETVLHNMVRGTGIAGMCGIPPKRGRFIRPLINVTRAEIERFCADEGLIFCVDSTNLDDAYTRNRIRHLVVPNLTSVNSAAVKNVSSMSETLREDTEFLNSMAEKCFLEALLNEGLEVAKLQQMPKSMAKRCIAKLFELKTGDTLERLHVNAVADALDTECRLSVIKDMTAEIKNGLLRFVESKPQKIVPITVEKFPLTYEGVKISKITAEEFKKNTKFNSLLLNNAADCDRICGILGLRGRADGDKIALVGRRCTKTFKKLLNEAEIDKHARDGLLVACDENGVVWLEGFGIDQRVSVSESTASVLVFEKLQ